MVYPLVLALHGAGERGSDNERQIQPHRLATLWADPVNQAANTTFVVAPQVPPNGRWTAGLPVDQSDFNDAELTTLAILDSLASEFSIDLDRVYVTGLSMGGHGTWDFICRLPERFAAAVPMSGNADASQASKLLHVPTWAFHGESDTVVRLYGARGLVQAMEDLGREVIYTDCRRAPVRRTNFECPGTMSNAALADAIDAYADLIFYQCSKPRSWPLECVVRFPPPCRLAVFQESCGPGSHRDIGASKRPRSGTESLQLPGMRPELPQTRSKSGSAWKTTKTGNRWVKRRSVSRGTRSTRQTIPMQQ